MKRLIFLVPLVIALLVGVSISNAQSASTANTYDLSWYTIDGGGAMNVNGGSYSLSGTIGQPDAGTLSGGSYSLAGGFWGGAIANYKVYLPLVLKNF